MELKISEALANLPTIDYRELNDLQGNLKDLSQDNFIRLKTNLFGAEGIPANGFVYPFYVWFEGKKRKPYIIDGHQRLRVIQTVGATPYQLPYVEVKAVNKKEAKQMLLLASSEYGKMTREGWDGFAFDLDTDWVRGLTTFEAFTLPPLELEEFAPEGDNALYGGGEKLGGGGSGSTAFVYKDANDDNFDIDNDLVDDFKTSVGDVYIINGRHFLICGDSRDINTYKTAENIVRGKFDALVTDPPYNVDYEGATKDKLKIENDNLSDSDFSLFLRDFYLGSASVLKKGAAAYIWHSSSQSLPFIEQFVKAGFLHKQQLIWVKNSIVLGRQDYHWQHEPCIYGWLDGAAHNWYSDRKQSTVLLFDKPYRNDLHPTMKPIPLFAYQIQNSTKEGDWVLDPFGGSGTTIIACNETNRNCVSVELSPYYCNIILNRCVKNGMYVKKYIK